MYAADSGAGWCAGASAYLLKTRCSRPPNVWQLAALLHQQQDPSCSRGPLWRYLGIGRPVCCSACCMWKGRCGALLSDMRRAALEARRSFSSSMSSAAVLSTAAAEPPAPSPPPPLTPPLSVAALLSNDWASPLVPPPSKDRLSGGVGWRCGCAGGCSGSCCAPGSAGDSAPAARFDGFSSGCCDAEPGRDLLPCG